MLNYQKAIIGWPASVVLAGAVYAAHFYADNIYVRQDYLTLHDALEAKKSAEKTINRFEYIATYRKLGREEGYDLRDARNDLSSAESAIKELRK